MALTTLIGKTLIGLAYSPEVSSVSWWWEAWLEKGLSFVPRLVGSRKWGVGRQRQTDKA